MSIHLAHLGIGRPKPKHRAVDAVTTLRAQNHQLLTQVVGAGQTITALERQLAETRAERDDAQQAAASVDRELLQARRELKRLEAANTAWEAQYANEHPVSVKAPRDLRAEDDRPTVPHGTDVRTLREAADIGPVIRIAAAPATGDPRTPTWVPSPDNETTQSLRVA